jgi:hypothetical protein
MARAAAELAYRSEDNAMSCPAQMTFGSILTLLMMRSTPGSPEPEMVRQAKPLGRPARVSCWTG